MTTATSPLNVGDNPRCQGTLRKLDGEEVDPSTVFAWYKSPAGTVTTYQYGVDEEVVKLTTGIYYMHVDVTMAGTYYYGFYSTGTAQAASSDGVFSVRKTVRG